MRLAGSRPRRGAPAARAAWWAGSVLMAVALALAAPVGAEETPIAADYEAALQALKRGDDREAAARLWRLLEANPAHAGAWLDLGILYCENGLAGAARQIFTLIEQRFAPSPAIRELIERYHKSGCVPPSLAARSRWTLGVSLGRDSNANLGTDQRAVTLFFDGNPVTLDLAPPSRAHSDNWRGLQLGWQAAVDSEWTAGAAISHRQYTTEHAYDQTRLQGELSRRLGDRLDTFWFNNLWLGGHDYLRSLGARTRQALAPESPWLFDASVGVQQYPAQRAYDSAQGEAKLGYSWRFNSALRVNAWAGAQLDHPLNERHGGARRGPVLQVEGQFIPAPGWRLDSGLRFQNLSDRKTYSPLFGAVVREQSLAYGWFSLTRHVAPQTRCSLAGQALKSSDRIALFDFAQNQLWLGCERDF